MHLISNTDILTGYNKELKVEVAGRRLHSSDRNVGVTGKGPYNNFKA